MGLLWFFYVFFFILAFPFCSINFLLVPFVPPAIVSCFYLGRCTLIFFSSLVGHCDTDLSCFVLVLDFFFLAVSDQLIFSYPPFIVSGG